MKRLCIFLIVFSMLLGAGVTSLFAKKIEEGIVVSFETKHREFLEGESLAVGIRISNTGNTPFIVDTYEPYLKNSVKIYIRNNVGQLLFPKREPKELEQIMVMPKSEQDFFVNIDDIYGLLPQGKYTAHVLLTNGDARTSSELVNFEIVHGIEMLKLKNIREGLVSNEFLRYTLLYWVRGGGEQLFLRIDNINTGRLYDFVQLGNLVRVEKPYIRFLPQNVVEVLHQNSRDNFIKTRISVGGDRAVLLRRETVTNPAAIKEAETLRRATEVLIEQEKGSNGGFLKRR